MRWILRKEQESRKRENKVIQFHLEEEEKWSEPKIRWVGLRKDKLKGNVIIGRERGGERERTLTCVCERVRNECVTV